MSIHFHSLAIKDIKKETDDCVSIALDIPKNLKERFAFTQGQSLTFRCNIDGKEIRRTYSICSSPMDEEWRVAVKKVSGGLFSTHANEHLKIGDALEVMPPVGKFYTSLNQNHKKNYVAFAAGSGITPILSIIKTTLATEPGSNFTLVYGNKRRSSIIFFEELESLKNKYMDRFNLIHVLSRERTESEINFGRISLEKLSGLSKLINYSAVSEFFICGPEEMIFGVKNFLVEKGISIKKIHFELFTSPGQKRKEEIKSQQPQTAHGQKSTITLKIDGRTVDFELSLNSETTILDAALQQGADLPYACKGGMCCTCRAKLVEGEVVMDAHWGLEEEEIEQGYILTCQSHPVSKKLVVDFDIK